MAESLIEIRRRISTIQSTAKITNAMKLVASVKFRKWKNFYDDSIAYNDAMHDMVVRTLQSIPESKYMEQSCLERHESEKTLYIVVTSTLGLCGSYNYNVYRTFDPIVRPEDDIIVIGQKGYVHYKDFGNRIIDSYVSLLDSFSFDNVRKFRHYIVRLYREQQYKSVTLVYTKFKNSITFIPTVRQLLPFDLSEYHLDENVPAYEPEFDPSPEEVLDLILPHYLDASLYNKLLETSISEFSSRRNAMESATDSANKLIDELQLTYNKRRQEAITQEITEIIAGSKATKQN